MVSNPTNEVGPQTSRRSVATRCCPRRISRAPWRLTENEKLPDSRKKTIDALAEQPNASTRPSAWSPRPTQAVGNETVRRLASPKSTWHLCTFRLGVEWVRRVPESGGSCGARANEPFLTCMRLKRLRTTVYSICRVQTYAGHTVAVLHGMVECVYFTFSSPWFAYSRTKTPKEKTLQ